MNVLLSSAGRRCALAEIFREALEDVVGGGAVLAVDSSPLSAAGLRADRFEVVPECLDPAFVPHMLDLCARHAVDVVVPTIDAELPVYAAHRDAFVERGTTVMVSSAETVAIASDKLSTAGWLVEQGLPTPRTAPLADVLAAPAAWTLPVIAKPRRGSASVGVVGVESWPRLEELRELHDMTVQELAGGLEYTVDAWVDGTGRCRCTVPRRRLEVRGGEVQKAMTVAWPALQDLVVSVAERLPGSFGPLNVQVFAAADDFRIIEINPRFGGGYPLAHQAGANFARWALENVAGLPTTARPDTWRSNVVMLRYDDAVFVDAVDVGL